MKTALNSTSLMSRMTAIRNEVTVRYQYSKPTCGLPQRHESSLIGCRLIQVDLRRSLCARICLKWLFLFSLSKNLLNPRYRLLEEKDSIKSLEFDAASSWNTYCRCSVDVGSFRSRQIIDFAIEPPPLCGPHDWLQQR